ncbi:MAG: hypothetical protein J6S76_02440, partial [Clostridia bacterium]|nr:hypothetical protein [Clostridia bacterium]
EDEAKAVFGKPVKNLASKSVPASSAVWDLNAEYEIDPDSFHTLGRSTPFAGNYVFGRCIATVYGGKCVYTVGQTE